ncbi:hypothetical protein [Niallia endozanthoxylica]|uniref:hypothetical protein n=1 Tax=Niallia endozanthoxylica TaxID=2036016 RepID=UPI00168A760C|nr:hypothetical protein [Niallia endozanthoxylica]
MDKWMKLDKRPTAICAGRILSPSISLTIATEEMCPYRMKISIIGMDNVKMSSHSPFK